jgi:hypothetical protein
MDDLDQNRLDDLVACQKCGARILAATAQVGHGLCSSCHGIALADISELVDRLREEAKDYQRSPFESLWLALVNRVADPNQGFQSLSDPEMLFFAAADLEAEVNNGGLYQYFFNSSAENCVHAIRALKEMDAEAAIQVLDQAKRALFPAGEMPLSTIERRKVLDGWYDQASKTENLDTSFFTDPNGLRARLTAFAIRHGLLEEKK